MVISPARGVSRRGRIRSDAGVQFPGRPEPHGTGHDRVRAAKGDQGSGCVMALPSPGRAACSSPISVVRRSRCATATPAPTSPPGTARGWRAVPIYVSSACAGAGAGVVRGRLVAAPRGRGALVLMVLFAPLGVGGVVVELRVWISGREVSRFTMRAVPPTVSSSGQSRMPVAPRATAVSAAAVGDRLPSGQCAGRPRDGGAESHGESPLSVCAAGGFARRSPHASGLEVRRTQCGDVRPASCRPELSGADECTAAGFGGAGRN